MLDIPTRGNIAFDGRTIYFINENSLLTAYDTKTHKERPFRNVVAYDLKITCSSKVSVSSWTMDTWVAVLL